MSHYDDTRNRFNPQNRFVGDIEDGKRYPFACYTKEESDDKYAAISTEADLRTLTATVNTKAAQSDVEALATAVNGKATEQECIDIRARLDALEYQPIDITMFNVSPNIIEMGSSNTIICTWETNKTPTSQNINGSAVVGNITQFTSVSTAQTYTLTAYDGQTTDTAVANVTLANQIYYGAAANLSAVTSLTSVLSNDPERTITVNATAGQYIVYAIPARLGNVEFFVGGFEGGFEAPVEQLLSNSSGYSETYKVYKSANAGLGETTIEVREG